MPQSINTIPQGFLEALGVQSLGAYPRFLEDNVRATFELASWYLEARTEILISTGVAATGNGDFTTNGSELAVPNGEIWWCDSLTHQLTGAAAVTGRINGYIRSPSGGTFTRQRATPEAALQGAGATDLVLVSQGGFWMRAGERPGVRAHLSGAASQFSWTMRVARLRV